MYITTEDVKNFIGPDCDEGTACSLADMSEAIFNSLINQEEGLILWEKYQYFIDWDFTTPAKQGRVFWLSSYNPVSITTINGVNPGSVNVDFILEGRRLEVNTAVTRPTAFPHRWVVVYTAGIAENAIGEDIKMACKYLAKWLFSKQKYTDITSFRQDLLQVNFNTGKQFLDSVVDSWEKTFLDVVVNKYRNSFNYAI